jgi:hypothetical protein
MPQAFTSIASSAPTETLASVTGCGNTSEVGKIRRDNFVLLTWIGDHSPRHVHIYRDGKLVLKWNLDNWVPMKGKPTAKLLKLLLILRAEGLL